jgi:hypothetical protein
MSDDDLLDMSELSEYNSFSFDEIYPNSNNSEIDIKEEYNNYNLEPENANIKRVILKVEDIPRTQLQNNQNIRIQQTIPKKNAKIVKPQVIKEEPKVTYEDILDRMGMFVSNGELHLKSNSSNSEKNNTNTNTNSNSNQYFNNDIPYSYIHNKYFKDYAKLEEKQPNFQDPIEYRNYLIKQIIHNYKIKNQIKSKKIFIPGESSFHFSPNGYTNLNKLFNFSKR